MAGFSNYPIPPALLTSPKPPITAAFRTARLRTGGSEAVARLFVNSAELFGIGWPTSTAGSKTTSASPPPPTARTSHGLV